MHFAQPCEWKNVSEFVNYSLKENTTKPNEIERKKCTVLFKNQLLFCCGQFNTIIWVLLTCCHFCSAAAASKGKFSADKRFSMDSFYQFLFFF